MSARAAAAGHTGTMRRRTARRLKGNVFGPDGSILTIDNLPSPETERWVTATYLRETAVAFRDYLRTIRSHCYFMVANLEQTVEEELNNYLFWTRTHYRLQIFQRPNPLLTVVFWDS